MKLFKGKRKGIVHTMDITLDHIRAVFFPKTFEEKFRYLGSVPYDNTEVLLKHLTIVLDYYAKPNYIPTIQKIIHTQNRKYH